MVDPFGKDVEVGGGGGRTVVNDVDEDHHEDE